MATIATSTPTIPRVDNLPERDNTGNTNAFNHHGRLFMLREDSRPYAVDPETLDTLEVGRFGNLGSSAMTAHPKIDPKTGEWWSYGVFASGEPTTDASLHVFDKAGSLIREEWFHTPYPGLSHDFARDPRARGVPDHAAGRRREAPARGRPVLPVRPRPAEHVGDHAAGRLDQPRCAGSRSRAS